jgi:hypothetical protein
MCSTTAIGCPLLYKSKLLSLTHKAHVPVWQSHVSTGHSACPFIRIFYLRKQALWTDLAETWHWGWAQIHPERVISIPISLILMSLNNSPLGVRVLLQKLIVPRLVKKFTVFQWTRMFITVFTRARHLCLSRDTRTQSTSSHLNSLSNILLLFPHLRIGLSSGLLPSILPPKHCMHFSFLLYARHAPYI